MSTDEVEQLRKDIENLKAMQETWEQLAEQEPKRAKFCKEQEAWFRRAVADFENRLWELEAE